MKVLTCLVSKTFCIFFLLSGFKFSQAYQVTGLSCQQFFPRTARFWNSLLAHYFPLTYNLNCHKSRIIRHGTNHKGRLLKRVWVGQQVENTWNRGRPSKDILFQKIDNSKTSTDCKGFYTGVDRKRMHFGFISYLRSTLCYCVEFWQEYYHYCS